MPSAWLNMPGCRKAGFEADGIDPPEDEPEVTLPPGMAAEQFNTWVDMVTLMCPPMSPCLKRKSDS